MSIGNPLCCGFIKCAIFEEQITTNTLSRQYQNLKLLFPGIKLSENIYKTRAKKVKEDIVWLAKKDKEKKKLFLESFCQESWKGLSNFKQQRHASFECKGCLGDETYRDLLSNLKINKKDLSTLNRAEEKGLFKPVKRKIIEETQKDINILNSKCKENYSITFDSTLKIAEKSSVRQKRSEIVKEVKENLEEQWNETAVIRYPFDLEFSFGY